MLNGQVTISQRELRNESGEVMRRVEQGESFTVTRNGRPVADLVPHRESPGVRPPRFVRVEVIGAGVAGLPAWGTHAFRTERDELDAEVDDRDVDPWQHQGPG